MRKKYLFTILILAVISMPFFAFAAPLVTCGLSSQDIKGTPVIEGMCTLCDLYLLAQSIMNFLMWQATPIIAIFAFSWAGFKILISGPNPGLRNEGFGIMKKTLIGVLIVFSSWIIINEVLIFFSGSTDIVDPKTGTTIKTGGILSNPWNAINCALPPAAFNNNASTELTALIADVQSKVPGIVIVPPTTDSNIPAKCDPTNHTTQVYNNPSACQHAEWSCHYGGKNCAAKGSYAFDFEATSATDPIYVAVRAAVPAQAFMQFEPLSKPHGHVSIGNIYSCNCQ